MTSAASSMSCCSTASIVRSSACRAISRPPRAWASSSASCSWNACRASSATALPETTADVVLGLLVLRVREDLLGLVDLDEPAGPARGLDVEERRVVARPAGLLHVVSHGHDRVVLLELVDQLLDG